MTDIFFSEKTPFSVKESEMRQNQSSTFICDREQLGKGAYGVILKASDEKGNKYAIKSCLKTENGISFPLEIAVMNSFIHPNLNNSIHVLTGDKKVEIVQDLAISDLRRYYMEDGRYDDIYDLPLEKLRKWCFGIAQALSILHKHDLIHGDIKANNLLLYPNDIVKLSDFGLVVKKLFPEMTFSHRVCTSTHRPPEVFLGLPWNESVDIWSLGCTFYELAFGIGLFSSQERFGNARERKTASFKKDRDKRLVNSLIDWFEFSSQEHNLQKNDLEYINALPCEKFKTAPYQHFNNLILSMLRFDPNKRLTISQVLTHPFFDSLIPSEGYYISRKRKIFTSNIKRETEVLIYQLCREGIEFRNFVYELFTRCSDNLIDHVESRYLIAACILIIYKSIGESKNNFREIIESYDLKYNIIVDMESIVCQDLNYHLI